MQAFLCEFKRDVAARKRLGYPIACSELGGKKWQRLIRGLGYWLVTKQI